MCIRDRGDGDPLLVEYLKPVYGPGEQADLKVTGTPGTQGFLLFDFEPGPVLLPGVGLLDVGFSPDFFA